VRYALLGCALAAVLLYAVGGTSSRPWAFVAVAGGVAVLATRTWGRPVVGVALVASGVAAAFSHGGWAGGVVLAATGAYVVARGREWQALGARYDAPQRREDPWAALDRGEDPTL
jgi:hypothetical protein